jgi:hypothetical protein
MYAIVRENTYDPASLARGRDQLDEFQALHARQPGYSGSLVVDVGGGRRLTINLWDSEEHAAAALPGLVPELRRLLEPLMAAPSRLVGAGPVVTSDLALTSELHP